MRLIIDEEYKFMFNEYFPKGADVATIEKAYQQFVLEHSISNDAQVFMANVMKACFASGIESLNQITKKALEYFNEAPASTMEELEPVWEEERVAITFMFLIVTVLGAKAGQLDSLIKVERDFITEVIANKFNVHRTEITKEMRSVVLNHREAIYSIEDPPIEGWDQYFFNICRQVARHSKCLSRRIGAVLVSDKSIISTGYNGPPRGVPRCDKRWELDKKFIEVYKPKLVDPNEDLVGKCPRYPLGAKSGQMLNICTAAHAEENSILDAARRGIKVKGATMYMTCGIPCTQCLIKIINAGIAEIVVTGITFYDENAEWLLNNSNVKVRLYDFEKIV